MKLVYIRRTVQLLFFISIVFGGFLISQAFNIEPDTRPKGQEKEISLLDAHLPVRTCRYIEPKPTLFETCGLRYILERPLYFNTWFPISLYILIILGFCFVFGRFMCGWFCPLGSISDFLDYIRQKLRLNRIVIPHLIKKIMKYWRYSFLLFLFFISISIALPFMSGIYMDKNFNTVICQLCPSRMIIPLVSKIFFPTNVITMPSYMTPIISFFSILSLIFLGIYALGVIITRPWCRICPNGTFTSLFNRGALLTKEKDVIKCTKCGICKRVCPFTNDHVYKEKVKKNINHPNCIMCLSCIDKCPEKDCLNLEFLGFRFFKSKLKGKL